MAHIYNESAATELVDVILRDYIPEFQWLEEKLKEYYGDLLIE